MSELSARLGLYAAIDQAVSENNELLEVVARVIPLYELNSKGNLPVDDRNGTAGWASHLGELLPAEAVIAEATPALRELASVGEHDEVTEVDQTRRLKAIWAAARVPVEADDATLVAPLRPLVVAALSEDGREPDGEIVEANLEKLSALVLDRTRFTTAAEFQELVQAAQAQGLVTASVALLATVGCEDWVVLVPVSGPSGVDVDPAARIVSTVVDFDIGSRPIDQIKVDVDPPQWPHCLPTFWCSMEQVNDPGPQGPLRYFHEVVGDCHVAPWFDPYLRFGIRDAPALGIYELQYDLTTPADLTRLSAGGPLLVQDDRVEVDSGIVNIAYRQRPGAPTGQLQVDITTSKTIRFKEPLPTGGVALVACLSGWADMTREMMDGCVGSGGT